MASQLKKIEVNLGEWHVGQPRLSRPLMIGIVLAVLTWLVIVRGIKSIGRAAEKLSPLKVGLYLVGGLVVIADAHWQPAGRTGDGVPRSIFDAGGRRRGGRLYVMMAMRYGIERGVYANEAGYGTAAVDLRHRQEPAARAARARGDDGCVHYFVRHLDDQCLSILLTGVWNTGATEPAADPGGFQRGDARVTAAGWLRFPSFCSATRC